MLRPQETATRERRSLNGLWRFALDPAGVGRGEEWFGRPLAGGCETPVPASYNEVAVDPEVRDHTGDVWFQTAVRVPRGWYGQRLVLHFEAVTPAATVWVNSAEVATHSGGRTPFEADLTEHVAAGEQARVTVLVAGGGIGGNAGVHGPVWLYTTGRVHLTDLTVVTGLSGTSGSVRYATEAHGIGDGEVRLVLRDADGAQVAAGTGASGSLTVRNVRRWAPGEAYLYDLEVRLVTRAGALLDSVHQSVGVRTVAVDGTRFLVNGQPFRFTGFGRPQDAPVSGHGHSDAFLVHDFGLLDWIGANSLRSTAGPYTPDLLDYADRRGILVIGEAQPGEIGAMVARDKNHPSVVLWSVGSVGSVGDTPRSR